VRSNGLAFSCRERAGNTFKTNDLAREAVSCNAGLGAGALAVYKMDFLSFGAKFTAFVRVVVFNRIL